MATRTLRYLFADHLSRGVTSLDGLDKSRDVVLMAEVAAEADHVPHHPKKIAFLFSAMRHLAAELRAEGVTVDYVTLDAPGNAGSLRGELARAVGRHRPDRVVVTEPGEWRVLDDALGWEAAVGVPVEIRADRRFFYSRTAFAGWARGRRQVRMEPFYRAMRRKTGLLMDEDGAPSAAAGTTTRRTASACRRAPRRPPRYAASRTRPRARCWTWWAAASATGSATSSRSGSR